MKKDIQVLEAEKDIIRSSKQIADLTSLDKDSFPQGLIDNLISFHQFRINNCQKALQSFRGVSEE